jgi:4-hydroxy-tetrahydrodipicolinate reductase
MTKLLLVGHGKMGKLVGELAPQYGFDVAGVIDPLSPMHGGGPDAAQWSGVDVAIDFTTPDVVAGNAVVLAKRGIPLVIGTTGWAKEEGAVRQAVADGGAAAVVAPNFSTGVVLFEAMVAQASRLFAPQQEFGAFVHEAHHAAKKDAPSGTALLLRRAMEQAGYPRGIDVSATRAGFIPGTHTVGFDGPAEAITLTHLARDRSAFARGALGAAQWVIGKHGWFTMKDVLGLARGSGIGDQGSGISGQRQP